MAAIPEQSPKINEEPPSPVTTQEMDILIQAIIDIVNINTLDLQGLTISKKREDYVEVIKQIHNNPRYLYRFRDSTVNQRSKASKKTKILVKLILLTQD